MADTTAKDVGGAATAAAAADEAAAPTPAAAVESRVSRRRRASGFDSAQEYFSSLKQTPRLVAKRAGYIRSTEEQMADKEAAAGDMKKVLNWFHVAALGTGADEKGSRPGQLMRSWDHG
jgi:hypothetical protein